MAAVSIKAVQKFFGSTHVIRGVDIDIADGEFCVLVGPSGCGKSTLLRMLAGLEEITHGEISIGGKVVNRVPPKERDIAMVFQNYALYPHMTVRDNMSFALMLAKQSKDEIGTRVKKAADILGLDQLLDRYPRQLSGGQRQRVAMGRAIVRDPAGVPVRRTAVESRREAARADAHRDQGTAPAFEDHLDLRHARPDRGDDHGRQDRGHEGRRDRADRRPVDALRSSQQHLRRRFHRFAGDEHGARYRTRQRRVGPASSSRAASRCPCRRAPGPRTGRACSTACDRSIVLSPTVRDCLPMSWSSSRPVPTPNSIAASTARNSRRWCAIASVAEPGTASDSSRISRVRICSMRRAGRGSQRRAHKPLERRLEFHFI